MNDRVSLLLVGEVAYSLKDRLQASGYSPIQWGCSDGWTVLGQDEVPMVAIVSSNQLHRIEHLRQRFGGITILLGVEDDTVQAREICFSAGADDIWLLNTGPSDLLQRLRLHLSLQKRYEKHCSFIEVGDLQLEVSSGLVRRANRPIGLTERESSLLLLLFQERGKAVSRDQILRVVWKDDSGVSSNVVEVYIRYLRQKLEAGGSTRLIHTIRGCGYCLNNGIPNLNQT